MRYTIEHLLWGMLRISLGFIFFWAFLDKVFGLGFSTPPEASWLGGISPTYGYLAYATHGPLQGLFQAIAGNAIVDWLFMLGLLCVGLSLILGIGVRVAGYAGSLMLFFMYLATGLPPEHNPVLDEHIIYILVLLLMTRMSAGEWLGLGKWWAKIPFVRSKRYLL